MSLLALSSACSGWVRVENAHNIPEGHALKLGDGRNAHVVSHVTACDDHGFGAAPPGCTCGDRSCVIDLRQGRLYVHDSVVDPGIVTTVVLIFGLAGLGAYLLSIEIK
jgi:hypothetical protein